MQINEMKFGIAAGSAFAILWLICSALVVMLPMPMMAMSGNMVHMDAAGINWQMGFMGFLVGLFAWTLSAGVTGWLIAFIYNKQL
jgi:hypothetical protein